MITIVSFFTFCSVFAFNTRGISPEDISRYSGSVFTCDEGKEIPMSFVNDDFCDCLDGTDEPGTSACSVFHNEKSFFCQNKGYFPKRIFASQVNDGVCDCCDGSDEKPGVCHNTCTELGRKEKKTYETHRVSIEKALKNKENAIRSANKELDVKKEEKDRLELKEHQLGKEVRDLENEKKKWEKIEEKERKDLRKQMQKESASVEEIQEFEEETKKEDNEEELEIVDVEIEMVAEDLVHEPVETTEEKSTENVLRADVKTGFVGVGSITSAIKKKKQEMKEELEMGANFVSKNKDQKKEVEVEVKKKEEVFIQKDELDGMDKKEIIKQLVSLEIEMEDLKDEIENNREELVKLRKKSSDVKKKEEEEKEKKEKEKKKSKRRKENFDVIPDGFWGRVFHFTKKLFSWFIPSLRSEEDYEYDEVKSYKNKDAEKARKNYNKKNDELEEIKRKIKELDKLLKQDYGPDNVFFSLRDECFSIKEKKFEYEFCPYGKAKQKDGSSSTNLGEWRNFGDKPPKDDDREKPTPEQDIYKVFHFDKGRSCWNGPNRAFTVEIICDVKAELIKVEEPSMCYYTGKFTTPLACTQDDYQDILTKLNYLEV